MNLGISVPANTLWRVESTESIAAPNWQLVDVVTANSPRLFWLRDIGQHGRLLPVQTSTRFYRLVAN